MQTDSLCKTPLQAKTHPLFFTKQMLLALSVVSKERPLYFTKKLLLAFSTSPTLNYE